MLNKLAILPPEQGPFVIPAKAGIQLQGRNWIPAFAGMTREIFLQEIIANSSGGRLGAWRIRALRLSYTREIWLILRDDTAQKTPFPVSNLPLRLRRCAPL